MSETANGFLKVISQLTAPKSAIKYIAVVGVLIGIVKYRFVDFFGIQTDYVVFATLLFAIGVGTLVGEGISLLFGMLWEEIKKRYAKNKLLKLEKEKKSEQDQSIKAAIEKLKTDFFVRVKALSMREKQILKDVYLDSLGKNGEQVYSQSNDIAYLDAPLDGPLFNLGFLQIIERFNSVCSGQLILATSL